METSSQNKERVNNNTSKYNIEIIQAPKGASYMSDFMKKLPSNVFIDKVTTGVGATTMALEAKEKFIIAVPYKALADNKAEWCERKDIDVLVVKSGVSLEEIKNFKGDKILVVFDSLYKLIEHLPEYNSFRLMVDEVHVILTSALFRGSGMHSILNNFKKFEDFVLITATPTTILYDIKEFKDVKKIRIEWQDNNPITFSRDIVTQNDAYNVADLVILICNNHLMGLESSNAYFFINSVKLIQKVVKSLKSQDKITSDDVNLVVAQGNESNIQLNLGIDYKIGKPPTGVETAKKLNFITSTGFEGQDFYDSNGKIYIVSDGSKSHTKLDILTQIPQISGRIRDSKLNDTIKIITSPSRLNESLTEKEYIKSIEDEFESDKRVLSAQLEIIEKCRTQNEKDTIYGIINDLAKDRDSLYVDNNGVVNINTTFVKARLHEWRVLHQSVLYIKNKYSGEVSIKEGSNYNIKFIDKKTDVPLEAVGKYMLGKPYSFRDICKIGIRTMKDFEQFVLKSPELNKENKEKFIDILYQIKCIDLVVIEAYVYIGPTEMRRLEYKRSDIEKAVNNSKNISDVAKEIDIEFGKFYSSNNLRMMLDEVYDKLLLFKKAKGTDIEEHFEVKSKTTRVNKEPVRGYIVKSFKK